MSLSLKSLELESWGSVGTNKDQNYLTHSLFRYFGKLPPVLTNRILKEFVPSYGKRRPLVLDIMCGSGTTLVECQKQGLRSIGVDANNIALLASKVKTSALPLKDVNLAITDFTLEFENILFQDASQVTYTRALEHIFSKEPCLQAYIPEIKNFDKWYSLNARKALAATRHWIEKWSKRKETYDFLLLSWLSTIRAASNASNRTGRIFHDLQKSPQNVFSLYLKKLQGNLVVFQEIPPAHFLLKPKLYLGDARAVKLEGEEKADFSLFHPPYFALYKYSSDVLRFELEWGGFSRKEILNREVRDGFKTTNASLMYTYVDDLVEVTKNALEHTKPGHLACMVVGNSTLSEKQLPVIETLIKKCRDKNIACDRIIERPISHSQATYHKSANPNINSPSDFLLIFRED